MANNQMNNLTLRKQVNVLIVIIIGLFEVSAQEPINKLKLDSLLNELYAKNRFMGSVTISKNGHVLYNKAYGVSSLQNNIYTTSTTDTRYRIGSITKMFTSVMIYQLIEENKLSMNTLLSDFFPEVPNSNKISISNLLSHRSGIYSFTDDLTYLSWNTIPQTHADMLKRICSGKPAFKPNKKAAYSNSNYLLLGYIIETITKKDFASNLEERIIKKIGLDNTYYGHKTMANKNECFSFKFDLNNWVPEPETDMSIPAGAGAIVSTTNDLTKFISALFEGKLISISSLNDMKTIEGGYGKGIFQKTFHRKIAFGHTGAIDGFNSSLYFITTDSTCIALCCNTEYGMSKLLKGMLAIYYNLPYQIPSLNSLSVSSETLKTYEGNYKHWILPIKLTLKINGDYLTADFGGQGQVFFDPIAINRFRSYSTGGSFEVHGRKLIFYQENMTPHKIKFKKRRKKVKT